MLQDAEIDVEIGRRLKLLRAASGMTVQKLARQMNTGYGDLERIENGAQRLKSSQLWMVSAILNVPVDYFVAGINDAKALTHQMNDGNIIVM
jgi:transcriptional regulator with XRE-family HTH domain